MALACELCAMHLSASAMAFDKQYAVHNHMCVLVLTATSQEHNAHIVAERTGGIEDKRGGRLVRMHIKSNMHLHI